MSCWSKWKRTVVTGSQSNLSGPRVNSGNTVKIVFFIEKKKGTVKIDFRNDPRPSPVLLRKFPRKPIDFRTRSESNSKYVARSESMYVRILRYRLRWTFRNGIPDDSDHRCLTAIRYDWYNTVCRNNDRRRPEPRGGAFEA